jgi:DNA-binding response OmpR family regulator
MNATILRAHPSARPANAATSARVLAAGRDAGAVAYLTKPVDLRRLLHEIHLAR